MKSPMVQNNDYIADKDAYSDMQVLQSGGGWYVGTLYTNTEDSSFKYQEPGSRDTDYFATKEDAEKFLLRLESGDKEAIAMLRIRP